MLRPSRTRPSEASCRGSSAKFPPPPIRRQDVIFILVAPAHRMYAALLIRNGALMVTVLSPVTTQRIDCSQEPFARSRYRLNYLFPNKK